jgi:hypothetical protein
MEKETCQANTFRTCLQTGRGFSTLQKFEKDRLQFKEEIAT